MAENEQAEHLHECSCGWHQAPPLPWQVLNSAIQEHLGTMDIDPIRPWLIRNPSGGVFMWHEGEVWDLTKVEHYPDATWHTPEDLVEYVRERNAKNEEKRARRAAVAARKAMGAKVFAAIDMGDDEPRVVQAGKRAPSI